MIIKNTNKQCRICGNVLVYRRLQIRADDEGETLVESCPTHGIQHSLIHQYQQYEQSMLVSNHESMDFLRPDRADGMYSPRVIIGTKLPSRWIEVSLLIHGEMELFQDLGEIQRCECSYSHSSWNVGPVVYSGLTWNNNSILTDLSSKALTSCFKKELYNGHVSKVSSLSLNSRAPRFYEDSAIVSTFDYINIESESVNPCYIIRELDSVSSNRLLFVMYVSHEKTNLELTDSECKSHSLSACNLYSRIAKGNAKVSRKHSWQSWINLCKTFVYFNSIVYLNVSNIDISNAVDVTCIESRGIYSAMIVCAEFVMILDTAMSRGLLLDIEVDKLIGDKMIAYSGYLNNNSFEILRGYILINDSNIAVDVPDCNNILNIDSSKQVVISTCKKRNSIGESWKLAYIGQQSTVCLLNGSPGSGYTRELDTTIVLEMVHKKILACIYDAVSSGFEAIVIIKSKPFRFYTPLIGATGCIFAYEENWDEEDHDIIEISNSNADVAYGEQPVRGYTYTNHHNQLHLPSTSSYQIAASLACKNDAVHLNCTNLSSAEIAGAVIVLDFYNQDCESFNNEWHYVSVVGKDELPRVSNRIWNTNDTTQLVDKSKGDIPIFCRSANLSLENIEIVCTPYISSYIFL